MNCKQIRTAAFTGRLNDPASYFRLRQYKDRLADLGISVQEFSSPFSGRCWYPGPLKAIPYVPGVFRSRDADMVWISRVLVAGYETFERLLKRPRVMDVDDAIWLDKPFGYKSVPRIASSMDAVIAGNAYLAEYFSKYCRNVNIVPTGIDLSRYQLKTDNGQEKFVIGWTGTSSNFPYLESVLKPLIQFLNKYTDSIIMVVADKPWNPGHIDSTRIKFVKWSREIEASSLQQMSVGIMPLEDSPWARGKCSFKMLQYMAVGLPVIASPVGMNKEVFDKGSIGISAVTPDQWYQALEHIYTDSKCRKEFGNSGRKVVEQFYSTDVTVQHISAVLHSVIS